MALMRSFYADFTRTFGNVLFAVCLLIAWALLTLLGVLVEQGKDAGAYFSDYAAPLARLILRLDFNNVYHAPYYVGVIGLILLSLAVCTFKRVIPARLPPLRPMRIEKIPLNASIETRRSESDARSFVEAFFGKRGWQVRKREFGGVEWTFADKHNWARRGVLVAHVGFVIIAAGTTIYWARGFSGDAAIVSGQTVRIPYTATTIRLDRFAYKIQPTMTKSGIVYQPIDYVSGVTVTGKDRVPHERTIRVNHPIDVDGTLYYQANYGFAVRLRLSHRGARRTLSDGTYAIGDSFTLPGTQRTILLEQFVPTVDRRSREPSPDPRVNDPAVALAVQDHGEAVGTALVPLRATIDVGDGWRLALQRYLMISGLQYRYDPGVPLVGVGAFVLLAGLVISFYLLPARLYIRVEGAAGRSRIGIAATTVKGYDMFEKQFADLTAELREVT